MRKILFGCLIWVSWLGQAQSVSFKTYKNPVIPGDHPDCTVSRVGNDFYTTGSSFNLEPQIYHSTDLVHWRVVGKPVSASWEGFGDAPGGGCWGGQMVFYKGKYWHFFSRANTMYFTTADKPEGPWSMPTRINNPPQLPYGLGYDNSVFIDDNGQWYLVVKNGQPNNGIVELDSVGQPTGVVYNLSWLNPAPSYPYRWAEGPVMWKYKGYYYYSFALDLGGGQKVMRSPVLTDQQSSWEMLGDFFNERDPLKSGSLFTSPNHSSAVVMAADSTFWVVHPLYAKGEWRGQGRQGLLNQVFYDSNDKPTAIYPINTYFTAPKLPSSGIPWMVPKSDFFDSADLNPEWQFYGYTPSSLYSLTERPGWLRLSPKSKRFNLLSKNDGEHNYSLITRVDFEPAVSQDEAGLTIMRGDEKMFVKLVSTCNSLGRKVIRFSFKNTEYQLDNIFGNIIWLKMVRINHKIEGYCSVDGIQWLQVGQPVDIQEIDSYSDFSTFTGTRQGLYVRNRSAYFDLYIYRDAYTPILAECPVNEFGTQRTVQKDGTSVLDSIHNNDWALYAGVEFGTSSYAKSCDSVEFAASAVMGGIIEVWLDSIDTGEKIASCDIVPTDGGNTFSIFKAKTKRVTGRHDVYLKFVGSEGGRLFQLKYFRFIPISAPRIVSAVSSDNGKYIEVLVSKPLLSENDVYGFTLYVNNMEVGIDSIRLSKISSKIYLYLQHSIVDSDTVMLTYRDGNAISVDSLPLLETTKWLVDNQMAGAKPRIKNMISNRDGEAIDISFSKKMNIQKAQCEKFILNINSLFTQNPADCHCLENDSTKYRLVFNRRFYYEDTVYLSYPSSDIMSVNGGTLDTFYKAPVTNIATGYPLQLLRATLQKEGSTYSRINLKFDKNVLALSYQSNAFQVSINHKPVTVREVTVSYDSVLLFFYPGAKAGDSILLSYEDGNIQSIYLGKLENFTNLLLAVPTGVNRITEHSGVSIYPNPSDGYLNVRSDEMFDFIRICSLQGVELFRKRINNPSYFVQLSLPLSAGMYMIEVKGKALNHKSKFMVK